MPYPTDSTSGDPRHPSGVELDPHLDAVALAVRLLEMARSTLHTSPAQAERSSRLAASLVERSESPAHRQLRIAALVHRARALQALGQRDDAVSRLDKLVPQLSSIRSPVLRGDLHYLAATIRSDARDLPAARHHAEAARTAYRGRADPPRAARLLLLEASLLHRTGNVFRAVQAAVDATDIARSCNDNSLLCCACHNLAVYLLDAGAIDQARDILSEILSLYPSDPDSLALLRYRWLTARLTAEGADPAAALSIYKEVHHRLDQLGHQRDADFVALDLAHLELALGNSQGYQAALQLLHDPSRRQPTSLGDLLSEALTASPSSAVLKDLAKHLRR